MKSEWKAGFDYSCAEAAFALLDENDQIVFDEHLSLNNRNAAELPVWMESILSKHGLDFNTITQWRVGSGPGSFTGLRLASALVMGFSFRKDVKCRCISTASAIAGTAGLTAERVLTLYDGKKNEILGYGLAYQGSYYADDGFDTVLDNPADAEKLFEQYSVMVALEKDHEVIRKVFGNEFAEKVILVPHLSAVPLITAAPGDFSKKLTDLVYLRPAVFVEPRLVRQDL
jgi:tRNA A37 threonylcarbamoyladenosine modification protein TsaB